MPSGTSVLVLASLLALAVTVTASKRPKVDCSAVSCLRPDCPDPITPPGQCCPKCPRSRNCWRVQCPQPLCANPVRLPGKCCASCENSGCNFEGCVNFERDGSIVWAPSPCLRCQCFDNKTVCASIACVGLTEEDCFGNPVVTRPQECCPSCNFGNDSCKKVRVPQVAGGLRNITVSDENGSCTKEVGLNTCNVRGFQKNGKTFNCRPWVRKRSVNFGKECPLITGFIQDVTQCLAFRSRSGVIGCDLFVE